ncbi:SRPBCC family protein [Methylocystis parvus]|uniref:SRPBCC family protein n=1 Tax=Methylocystis parvus TaxID=134 RepID=UPI003C70A69D
MSSLSRRAALFALAALAPLASAARAAEGEVPVPGPNSWAAHGAAPLKSVETILIDAPPDKVWAVIGDFAHYDWLPGVARVEASGGNTPEKAKRKLVMADGGAVEETLVKWDAERMTLAFHRDHDDVKRFPAINYMTHVTAKPAERGKTLAEWKGRFYRGHPFNDPPKGLDDDTALAAVTKLHRANLAALKARVEGR